MHKGFEDSVSGSYRIDRELGRGGMATVYLAHDVRHNRRVALKVLHPELSSSIGPDRFLREIELAARLNHPHIVPLFDSGEAGGFLYYVMPVVEGETLRDRLLRDGQIPVEESLQLVRGIASALDYAHRQNIVHRDIKPENVMLQDGEAVVMDFGIGKAVSVAAEDTLTQTGMVVGTPAYVSPEQAAGETRIDGRSDQYSLACVLYEMLSGRKPFSGPTAQSVISKRFSDPIPSLRAVFDKTTDEVENAIQKALSRDAPDRFATTVEFARALVASHLSTPDGSPLSPGSSSAKSIAVLPFTNMSADPEGDFFADGIADEIITALSKVKALRVVSRTSSFTFKGKNDDIREIGRKLQVSTILEGSIRKAGKRLRLNAQLVSTTDSSQLWAERYDRELEDVFAIQDEIAASIVAALRVVLTEDEKKAIENVPTTNIDAYEYYLRGRQFFHQHRRRAHVEEFGRIRLGIPHGHPRDALPARRIEQSVAITIPAGRSLHSKILVFQVRKQEQARLEFAECVLVSLCHSAESGKRDACWYIAIPEERSGVKNLLGGLGHVLIDRLPPIPILEVPHEFGAAQVRKDQRLLNYRRRAREYWHRCLVLADHVAHAIPSAGKVHRDVGAAKHR